MDGWERVLVIPVTSSEGGIRKFIKNCLVSFLLVI